MVRPLFAVLSILATPSMPELFDDGLPSSPVLTNTISVFAVKLPEEFFTYNNLLTVSSLVTTAFADVLTYALDQA